ncbi:hypothetical protein BU23DRAFT_164738 [Bimuria novae-zelandiae CBS 107.79]|uniref:Jacalin-type lectin domain-containing protein n=1 Tax=Bimuria novae-zelandiae CBS 107.79 TaxID=1447943 RepID=A0A6A5V5C6_9PLEO|nr:hypothetical protein BU23DRAFT_164738 [Bimuria novae-zelandiae CBS 107.79]
MKFANPSTLWAIAAFSVFLGHAQALGDCDSGPWKAHAVGYDTGGPWCATKWKEGAAINGIQAWYNGDSVNGIEFQYTNGAAPERYGQMTGDKKEWLQWDTTQEEVEYITVWPNGRSDVKRVAAIEIKISNREPWKAGNTPKNTQGYDSPVVNGAGIIMGAYGNHGGSIDMIAFLMMESGIKNREVKDFSLNEESLNGANEKIKNANPEAIDSFTQENWTGQKMEYTVDREIRKLKSWSTTRSSSHTFGGSISASIDFGLPAIGLGGSISTEYHWETINSIETTESGEKEETLYFSVAGMIPKGEAIYCESLAFSGKYDLDYGSTIDLELQSGQRWTYHEAGTVKGVAWSRNENKCISYKKGENGAEILQAKLAEWKEKPEKEEQEKLEREQRAKESLEGGKDTAALEKKVTTLQQQVAALKKQIAALKKKNTTLQEENDQLTAELDGTAETEERRSIKIENNSRSPVPSASVVDGKRSLSFIA